MKRQSETKPISADGNSPFFRRLASWQALKPRYPSAHATIAPDWDHPECRCPRSGRSQYVGHAIASARPTPRRAAYGLPVCGGQMLRVPLWFHPASWELSRRSCAEFREISSRAGWNRTVRQNAWHEI